METKSPVLLLVCVETAQLRWFATAIGLDGRVTPLICSEPGDLAHYRDLDFEEQVAFVRHRFCGVLQRGCDRLWARNWKACQFAFVFEGLLPESTGTLTQAVAEHFSLWMLNPPVAVFATDQRATASGPLQLALLAGHIDLALEELLRAHLGESLARRTDEGSWEMVRRNGVWC
jgi:hypothetical protein